MANENTEVDLEELHTAIAEGIAAQFPALQFVEFYRDNEDEKIKTPACVLEMTECEPLPAQDTGTGQFPALLRFEARIILAHRSTATRLEIRKLATALATFLYLKRWAGIATDPAQVIACEPDEFAPNLDRFAVWRVEFVHEVMLGVNVWNDTGETPEEILYSFVPIVGIPHEPDYARADGEPRE